MYRRRRLVVLLGLLIVIAAVVLAFWQPWRSDGAPAPRSSTPAATGTAAAPAATGSAPAEGEPTIAAPPVDPAASPTIAPCATRDIVVQALTDLTEYGAGENPQLSISLTNQGTASCYLDVGTSQQAFVITSGSDTWWRSTDCQTEPSGQVVQLEPGQTVSSAAPLVWDRTRSSVETCDGDRPAALPGTYNLTVTVGGITSAESARFMLL